MPNENDTPNEKNMLIEAYRIQVERWNKRRDIEWRVTLTLWSTILIITFAIAGKIQPHCCVIVAIYATLFLIYLFWTVKLWERNAEDKTWLYKYQAKINEELSVSGKRTPLDNAPKNALQDWSVISQLLFALILLVGSGLILHHMPKSDSSLISTILRALIR